MSSDILSLLSLLFVVNTVKFLSKFFFFQQLLFHSGFFIKYFFTLMSSLSIYGKPLLTKNPDRHEMKWNLYLNYKLNFYVKEKEVRTQ